MIKHSKAILRLGIPIAIGQLGIIIMGFADTMMMGRYNTSSLAAASFVNSVFNLVLYFMIGYSYGLTPIVSALFGKGKKKEVGGILKQALLCNIFFALILIGVMGVLYFFLDCMGQPSELLPLIRPYYLIMLVSMIFVALFNVLRQFTDGVTDTSTGMWVLLFANIFHIIINFLLIYGIGPFPELGLVGAGLSTLLSRFLAMAIQSLIIIKRKRYATYREGFISIPIKKETLRHINAQSMPISLQMGMETGAFTFSGVMAGWLGAVELATFQIINTLGSLGYMLYYSFGAGMSIRLAVFYGTKNWQQMRETERAGRYILLAVCMLSSSVFLLFGEKIIALFSTDLSVMALSVSILPLLVLYQVADSMQVCYSNALRSTTHVVPMMWVAFVSYIVVNIPFGYILAFGLNMGLHGLYVAFSMGLLTAAMLFYYYFSKVMSKAK